MSDSDLDDELLYVAGRKRTAPKKRGRQASDSDSDYEHDAHAVHKEPKGASKRSKKPAVDKAPHVEPADDEDPMSTLPPEEQARLMAMTELEREQALFELVEARERERDKRIVNLAQREEQRVRRPGAGSRAADPALTAFSSPCEQQAAPLAAQPTGHSQCCSSRKRDAPTT